MFSCYYLHSELPDFQSNITKILSHSFSNRTIRLVFFGTSKSNEEYKTQVQIINENIKLHFGAARPIVSYVAQKPLYPNGILVEVHELDTEYTIDRKTMGDDFYILLQKGIEKHLLLGGIFADLSTDITTQSDTVFTRIHAIMQHEGFAIESIVRQWNYIERITTNQGSRQHYQDFNDARSRFYAHASSWNNGYPAATGIGTQWGGIMIDLQASLFSEIHAIDNPLQISAHEYSKAVLVGEITQKSTPKFERAKVLRSIGGTVVFISGTAAIRGEKTLEVGIKEQTTITIENIEHLISTKNLSMFGFQNAPQMQLQCLRVYLKHAEMLNTVRQTIETHYPNLPQIYILSDVCRDNLLIEMEGIAVSLQ